MPKKRASKKSLSLADIDVDTKHRVAKWMLDRLAEMDSDAESIAEEEGPQFMPAIRAVAESLQKQGD